jgi:opacity protein-like surface antigen
MTIGRLVLAVILAVSSALAVADGLILEAGASRNTYEGDTSAETAYRLRVGWDNAYLWAGTEQPGLRLLGQGMGTATVDSAGLGFRRSWDGLTVFAEAGYGRVDFRGDARQQQEVNYTYLVGRHNVEGRPVPVECARPGCFETEHTIDDALMGRVGLEYDAAPHVKLTASYRWMRADEYLAIWDAERHAAGKGWWEEHVQRDFGAFEIGAMLVW